MVSNPSSAQGSTVSQSTYAALAPAAYAENRADADADRRLIWRYDKPHADVNRSMSFSSCMLVRCAGINLSPYRGPHPMIESTSET